MDASDQVIAQVLETPFLDDQDMRIIRMVCKSWNDLASQNRLWRRRCSIDFGINHLWLNDTKSSVPMKPIATTIGQGDDSKNMWFHQYKHVVETQSILKNINLRDESHFRLVASFF